MSSVEIGLWSHCGWPPHRAAAVGKDPRQRRPCEVFPPNAPGAGASVAPARAERETARVVHKAGPERSAGVATWWLWWLGAARARQGRRPREEAPPGAGRTRRAVRGHPARRQGGACRDAGRAATRDAASTPVGTLAGAGARCAGQPVSSGLDRAGGDASRPRNDGAQRAAGWRVEVQRRVRTRASTWRSSIQSLQPHWHIAGAGLGRFTASCL